MGPRQNQPGAETDPQVRTADAVASGPADAGTAADPRTAGTAGSTPAAMAAEPPLPAPGFAEVRIVAGSPEAARRIAQVLRFRFAATEQRGTPAGDEGGGTRLHLTVDTVHFPDRSGPFQLRLVGGSGSHPEEVQEVTDVPPAARPQRPAPNSRLAKPPTPDEPSGDRPTT